MSNKTQPNPKYLKPIFQLEKNKTVEALNQLIQVNIDRMAGYETAFDETTNTCLKNLFANCMQTSNLNNEVLTFEVKRLGGEPVIDTKTAFKLLKIWMNIKTFLTNHRESTILKSCLFGEKIAIMIYKKVLICNTKSFNNEYKLMINSQLENIGKDNRQVKLRLM
jgi:uncharacterized protein (TIGR02284 family)